MTSGGPGKLAMIQKILHFKIGWSVNGNLLGECFAVTIFISLLNFSVTHYDSVRQVRKAVLGFLTVNLATSSFVLTESDTRVVTRCEKRHSISWVPCFPLTPLATFSVLQKIKPKYRTLGTSPAVQWLRLRGSTAGGVGLIPGWGTKIPHAPWHG